MFACRAHGIHPKCGCASPAGLREPPSLFCLNSQGTAKSIDAIDISKKGLTSPPAAAATHPPFLRIEFRGSGEEVRWRSLGPFSAVSELFVFGLLVFRDYQQSWFPPRCLRSRSRSRAIFRKSARSIIAPRLSRKPRDSSGSEPITKKNELFSEIFRMIAPSPRSVPGKISSETSGPVEKETLLTFSAFLNPNPDHHPEGGSAGFEIIAPFANSPVLRHDFRFRLTLRELRRCLAARPGHAGMWKFHRGDIKKPFNYLQTLNQLSKN